MNDKKQYTAPEMKVVEFKVEKGFAMSQSTSRLGLYSDRRTIIDGGGSLGSTFHPSGGYFSGNNDNWD